MVLVWGKKPLYLVGCADKLAGAKPGALTVYKWGRSGDTAIVKWMNGGERSSYDERTRESELDGCDVSEEGTVRKNGPCNWTKKE